MKKQKPGLPKTSQASIARDHQSMMSAVMTAVMTAPVVASDMTAVTTKMRTVATVMSTMSSVVASVPTVVALAKTNADSCAVAIRRLDIGRLIRRSVRVDGRRVRVDGRRVRVGRSIGVCRHRIIIPAAINAAMPGLSRLVSAKQCESGNDHSRHQNPVHDSAFQNTGNFVFRGLRKQPASLKRRQMLVYRIKPTLDSTAQNVPIGKICRICEIFRDYGGSAVTNIRGAGVTCRQNDGRPTSNWWHMNHMWTERTISMRSTCRIASKLYRVLYMLFTNDFGSSCSAQQSYGATTTRN